MSIITEARQVFEEEEKDMGEVSDGYHTFNELYDHRFALFGALCKQMGTAWKSHAHHHENGTSMTGWFIAGVELPSGMITYHLPVKYFDAFPAKELESAPEWDGHTSHDVVDRLMEAW